MVKLIKDNDSLSSVVKQTPCSSLFINGLLKVIVVNVAEFLFRYSVSVVVFVSAE